MFRTWADFVAPTLLAVHFGLLAVSLSLQSTTWDEPAHIASGVMHWQSGTFAAYRVNPPLPRMLAVLPVLLDDPNLVPAERGDAVDPFRRVEMEIGEQFAYLNRGRFATLVWHARWAGIGWSVLGGWLVYCWSRDLYGRAAGWLGLTLWCFEPNALAHAQLVTPDLPATVAGLLAAYALWRYLRAPSLGRALLAGTAFGLALLTKFTLLVLAPVWLILWAAWAWRPAVGVRPRPREVVAAGALTLLLINLGYGFVGTGVRLDSIPFTSHTFAGEALVGLDSPNDPRAANRFADTWVGRLRLPIPADYLRGIDVQRRDFEAMHRWAPSYLGGRWQEYGWWYYYLYAAAVKLPLGTLALVLAGVAVTLLRLPPSAGWRDELTVYLPALAILLLVSSQTGFNHHARYALPALPFALIGASKLGRLTASGKNPAGYVVLALASWSAGSCLAAYPHALSYFNEAAGGPANGSAHLLDSNIDWGQDIAELQDWLSDHPEALPMRFALYAPSDSLGLWLTNVQLGPPPLGIGYKSFANCGPRPGWYAVSVNVLRGAALPGIPAHSLEYFRCFAPVGRAGYSIYIYHLTADEANRVRGELGLPLIE